MATPSIVYSIIQKQVDPLLLDGYVTDILDEANARFCAITFNKIDSATYHNYQSAHYGLSEGAWGADEEKSRIYSDDGCSYTSKTRERCIEEGVYRSFSVRFYGCRYNNWWYIQTELTFFGEHVGEKNARELMMTGVADKTVLTGALYSPMGTYFQEVKGVKRLSTGVEMIEFIGMPWLVAYQKQREKAELCSAFSRLFNIEIFLPFKKRLMVANFEEFAQIIPLFSLDFTPIFPLTREYVLVPVMKKSNQNLYSICYFFWHYGYHKMYHWTYFSHTPTDFSYHYGETIIADLAQISPWNNSSYLQSSCTMDDETFWANYVLPQENGRFKYLVECPC